MTRRGRKKVSHVLGVPLIGVASVCLIGSSYASWSESHIIENNISTGVFSVVGDDTYYTDGGIELLVGNNCIEPGCYYDASTNPYNMPIAIKVTKTRGTTSSSRTFITGFRVSFQIENKGDLPAKYTINDINRTLECKDSYGQIAEGKAVHSKAINSQTVRVKIREGVTEALLNLEMKGQNIILPGETIECYTDINITGSDMRIRDIVLEAQVCIAFQTLDKQGWRDDTCNSIAVKRKLSDQDLEDIRELEKASIILEPSGEILQDEETFIDSLDEGDEV